MQACTTHGERPNIVCIHIHCKGPVIIYGRVEGKNKGLYV